MRKKILLGLIGGLLLAIIGFFIGMNLGGNYFASFEFLGGRGYEATGYLGAIIGAAIGLLLGVFAGAKMSNK